jgi:vacuolar-type H+-ATPase subunit I/STV1
MQKQVTGWVGWVYFAGMLMFLVGVFQMIAGFVALFKNDIYVAGSSGLVVFDYSQWGWIHIFLGLLLFITAISVMAGSTWARIFGAIIVGLNAISNFAFLPASPIWSTIIIAVDILIIWALLVHGGEVKMDQQEEKI